MRSIQDEALNRMIFFGEKSLDLAFPLKLYQRTNMHQPATSRFSSRFPDRRKTRWKLHFLS